MKKLFFLLIALTGTLLAGDFRKEFLDEVLKFSELNPPEIAETQQAFVRGFYDQPHQQLTGKDEEVRPLYVTAQGDFERALALFLKEKKVKSVRGIIHTPTPATPLCTKGEISESLVDESMTEDQRRLYTVMKRPEIIREFLKNGGKLMVVYPEKGAAAGEPAPRTHRIAAILIAQPRRSPGTDRVPGVGPQQLPRGLRLGALQPCHAGGIGEYGRRVLRTGAIACGGETDIGGPHFVGQHAARAGLAACQDSGAEDEERTVAHRDFAARERRERLEPLQE